MSEAVASKLRSLIEEKYGDCVVFAVLFGSVATGKAGPLSDVDVAVKIADNCDPLAFIADFSVDASDVLGVNHVDVLIISDDLPYELKYRALAGRLIYAKDKGAYIDELVKAFSLWADFQIFLRKTGVRERFAKTLWEKSRR
ncbi:nucleotidyltransferase domain-containing protein [Pyrobaculum sp.]|uniref:nucleotidyltransferase domain-containing protein n=1 Tax=Pyrobaculum sp. TaxID=2004705 RepID=UPI00315F66EB